MLNLRGTRSPLPAASACSHRRWFGSFVLFSLVLSTISGSSASSGSNTGSVSVSASLPSAAGPLPLLGLRGVLFLSGSTGFIGSVLLEQLLRLYPDLRVCVLVRHKRGQTPSARVAQLLASPLFDLLHAQLESQHGGGPAEPQPAAAQPLRSRAQWAEWLLEHRLRLVEGDLCCADPPLGLTAADRDWLTANVTFWVHAAASITLTLPLADALRHNFVGSMAICEMAAAGARTEGLLHVPTAYVAGAKEKGAAHAGAHLRRSPQLGRTTVGG